MHFPPLQLNSGKVRLEMNLSAKNRWEGPDGTWDGAAKGKSLALPKRPQWLSWQKSVMLAVPRGSAAWQHGVSEGKCTEVAGLPREGTLGPGGYLEGVTFQQETWGPCHHNFLYIEYQCLSKTDSKCSFLRNHTKIRAKQVQLCRVSSFIRYCWKKQSLHSKITPFDWVGDTGWQEWAEAA